MCDRCGGDAGNFRELTRFPEVPGGDLITEYVCEGCCTRTELGLSAHIRTNPELLAYCLAMSDALDNQYRAYCQREGISELGVLLDG